MSYYKNLMNQFKRDDKQEFKQGTLQSPTHIVNVSQAICKFPDMVRKLENVHEGNKGQLSKVIKGKQLKIAGKLIWLEAHDKPKLKDMLNSCIFNNPVIEDEMASLIHSKEEALDIAFYLGVLDDYYDYLDSGVYKGPTTKI